MNSMGIGRKKTVVLRKTFFTFFFYSVNVNNVKEYIAGKHFENGRLCETQPDRLVRLCYS